jgi:hypothetical protein
MKLYIVFVLILGFYLTGVLSAELVFHENFESDKLNEKAWGTAGAGVGGPNGGTISDKQAHSGAKSWWIGSTNGIYHIVNPPLQTATIYIYFYDNEKEASINAQVIGCTSETTKVTGWPIGAGSWMYMGLCTTSPACKAYYFRSADKGEICVGDKRETGWHLFAYVIDQSNLSAYVDGKKMEDCKMTQLGNFVIFHAWSDAQFLVEGGFVDDIYIFSNKMDPAKDPTLAVESNDKLAITWGDIKR